MGNPGTCWFADLPDNLCYKQFSGKLSIPHLHTPVNGSRKLTTNKFQQSIDQLGRIHWIAPFTVLRLCSMIWHNLCRSRPGFVKDNSCMSERFGRSNYGWIRDARVVNIGIAISVSSNWFVDIHNSSLDMVNLHSPYLNSVLLRSPVGMSQSEAHFPSFYLQYIS